MNDSGPQRPKTPLVRFENAGLRYNAEGEALRDVTFELPAGSFYFVTGPSGAGKSTLLKMMYLALRPTRGRVEIFDTDIGAASRHSLALLRRRIGVVFQDFRLLPHLTVFENVALPFQVIGADPKDYEAEIAAVLEHVGLGHRPYVYPEMLSGGEQQRVAIARAVVARPDLVIADEPTGNVDPMMGRHLLRTFVDMQKFGTTVVIASHDKDLVKRSGAPMIEIEGGQIVRFEPW